MISVRQEKLSDELADIVITTFTCAKVCRVDLWKAVERKLDMEIRRWEKPRIVANESFNFAYMQF